MRLNVDWIPSERRQQRPALGVTVPTHIPPNGRGLRLPTLTLHGHDPEHKPRPAHKHSALTTTPTFRQQERTSLYVFMPRQHPQPHPHQHYDYAPPFAQLSPPPPSDTRWKPRSSNAAFLHPWRVVRQACVTLREAPSGAQCAYARLGGAPRANNIKHIHPFRLHVRYR